MLKFTELEKGAFVKNGREYDYIIEIADDFPKKKTGNVRLKIIEEKPVIRKIRTRYDPEIELYGDKDASMELILGYDPKELKKAFRFLLFTSISPFYLFGAALLLINFDKIPIGFMPNWIKWILLPVLAGATLLFFKFYCNMNMNALAEYLKASDLKKMLDKEGFKQ